ncbi:hypothetical protein J3A83DRAFT_1130380 [Scleroderma citrinum]
MSTPSPLVVSPSVPSMTFETAPPATSTPSSGGSSSQNGSNYFFGFIATFIVLLLIFVSCGVGSRRRSGFIMSAWSRTFAGNEIDGALYRGQPASEWLKSTQTSPVLREVWLRPTQGLLAPGEDLQPISAAFVRSLLPTCRPKASLSSALPSPPEAPLDTRSPVSSHSRPSICSRISAWLKRRWLHRLPEPPPQPMYSSPEAVQVAVMVSMPSLAISQCYGEGKGEGPSTLVCPPLGDSISGGYEIGLIQLPWSEEIT